MATSGDTGIYNGVKRVAGGRQAPALLVARVTSVDSRSRVSLDIGNGNVINGIEVGTGTGTFSPGPIPDGAKPGDQVPTVETPAAVAAPAPAPAEAPAVSPAPAAPSDGGAALEIAKQALEAAQTAHGRLDAIGEDYHDDQEELLAALTTIRERLTSVETKLAAPPEKSAETKLDPEDEAPSSQTGSTGPFSPGSSQQ